MALRPPQPRQRRRRPRTSLLPDIALVAIIITPVLLLGLRLSMTVLGIADWTIAFQVLNVATILLVWPFDQFAGLRRPIVNEASVSEMMAFIIAAATASYVLATMTVRYER